MKPSQGDIFPELVVRLEILLCYSLRLHVCTIAVIRVHQKNTNRPEEYRPPPFPLPNPNVEAVTVSKLLQLVDMVHVLVVIINQIQAQEFHLLQFARIQTIDHLQLYNPFDL